MYLISINKPESVFKLVGILTSQSFQKCKCYIERLCQTFPKLFSQPIIRPMLNVDWDQYLTKARRKYGGKLWYSKKCAAVFINNEYLGDDDDLMIYIRKNYFFTINANFEKLGQLELVDHIRKTTENGRRYVYLTIAIDGKHIGSLLFLLYNDLVPHTCHNFLNRCTKSKSNYLHKPIQRIAKSGWIQCGGYTLRHKAMACENYVVPHDRRGVLSMCNSTKHTNNSTQFLVTLNAMPWMNYKYVAFGQLVQGEEVLRTIETEITYYEAPVRQIEIVKCGEFSLGEPPEESVQEEIERYLKSKVMSFARARESRTEVASTSQLHDDVLHAKDVRSDVLLRERYMRGLYSFDLDNRLYSPLRALPSYLLNSEGADEHRVRFLQPSSSELLSEFGFEYLSSLISSITNLDE